MTIKKYADYTCCMHEECPKAQQCLRFIAYGELDTDFETVHLINPKWDASATAGCSYFVTAEKQRIAWGVKNLYDTIPHAAATSIKATLLSQFGRTKYYRFYREEEPLSPEEQQIIKNTFEKHGVTSEPCFTRYTEEYIWN